MASLPTKIADAPRRITRMNRNAPVSRRLRSSATKEQIQLLKKKGATVFTTVSTDEKAALARSAGVDETILYNETDFVEAVKKFTNGKGVHVVYDSVGKTTYEGSFNVLRRIMSRTQQASSNGQQRS
jgi:D-arabinose 1-dehydrogenase-like Zn-dependent alcohol dehydrogenase